MLILLFLIILIIIVCISFTPFFVFGKKGKGEKENSPSFTEGKREIAFKPHYSRKLSEEEAPYAEREERELISLKLGQRKLLFTELEFYTKMLKLGEEALIVYAGAASGSHNPPLLKLFNHCEFHFYDKNPFSSKLEPFYNPFSPFSSFLPDGKKEHKNYFEKKITEFPLSTRPKKGKGDITEKTASNFEKESVYKKNLFIFDQYFMIEDAERYTPEKRTKKMLFLSDIRTSGYEDGVEEDLQLQQRWCEIIRPDMAMLKMRLRWKPGKTEYFDGVIYTQPHIGPKSTETRLWTDCKTKKLYDNDSYNNRCYFFQKFQRNAYHLFLPTSSLRDEENGEKINLVSSTSSTTSETSGEKNMKEMFFFKCLREKETDDPKMRELKKKLAKEVPNVQSQIKGMDHCNDCWSEIYIVLKYLLKFRSQMGIVEFFNFLDSPEALNVPPHNLLVNETDINKRITVLEKKTLEYAKEYKEGRVL